MTHIREKWVLNKHRCFPGTVLIEKPLPNLLLFIAQIYPDAKIQQPQYYHIGPDYCISTVQNTNKSFSLIQKDIYIFTLYHKHPKGSSHLLSSLRPTPYLFAPRQLAWKLPKKWEKKCILILWQVQTITKKNTSRPNIEINRSWQHIPQGRPLCHNSCIYNSGSSVEREQKEVKCQEAQCETVSPRNECTDIPEKWQK